MDIDIGKTLSLEQIQLAVLSPGRKKKNKGLPS